jgi:hypothetical protein
MQLVQSVAQRGAALLLTLSLACCPPAHAAVTAESFQGVPRIVDGDTLVVSAACMQMGTQYVCCVVHRLISLKASTKSEQSQPGTHSYLPGGRQEGATVWPGCPRVQAVVPSRRRQPVSLWCGHKSCPMLWTCGLCHVATTITVQQSHPGLHYGFGCRHTRHALQVRRSPSCWRPRSGSRVCGVRPRPPTSTAARHARVHCTSSIALAAAEASTRF